MSNDSSRVRSRNARPRADSQLTNASVDSFQVARPLPVWVAFNRHNPDPYAGQDPEKYGGVGRSRWNSFLNSTAPMQLDPTGRLDEKALLSQGDYETPWCGIDDSESTDSGQGCFPFFRSKGTKRTTVDRLQPHSRSSARYLVSEESRKVWKPRLTFILLNNPYVPLTLRTIMFVLSVIALGMACSIFVHSRHARPLPITQQPSTIMAVVVQTCALVYIVYITYDEYSGKPLGLREPKAKMRLIMLDLLFIIFSCANLALAFNTLYDPTWTCHWSDDISNNFSVPYNFSICSRQRALASLLFLILVSWVATFTISIFRLVERVTQ